MVKIFPMTEQTQPSGGSHPATPTSFKETGNVTYNLSVSHLIHLLLSITCVLALYFEGLDNTNKNVFSYLLQSFLLPISVCIKVYSYVTECIYVDHCLITNIITKKFLLFFKICVQNIDICCPCIGTILPQYTVLMQKIMIWFSLVELIHMETMLYTQCVGCHVLYSVCSCVD